MKRDSKNQKKKKCKMNKKCEEVPLPYDTYPSTLWTMMKKENARCKTENQAAGAFRFLPFFRLSAVDVAPFDLGCPLTALVLSGA